MRTNKFRLSLAVVGLLVAASVTNAAAETDGWFVGGQLGLRGLSVKVDASAQGSTYITGSDGEWVDGGFSFGAQGNGDETGVKYGLLAGYKQFFTENFGARYYAGADFGHYTYNYNANADALYNFMVKENFELGVFAGLWLGYVIHDLGNNEYFENPSGVDFGLNVGLRANIAQNHGVELFGRFGFLEQKSEYKWNSPYNGAYETVGGGYVASSSDVRTEIKCSQPYHIGVRYIYSF